MRRFLALLSVVAFFAEAEIITTNKIEDIENEFAKTDNETLVIFDYDDVLLEPVDAVLLTINEEASKKIAAELMKRGKIGKKLLPPSKMCESSIC